MLLIVLVCSLSVAAMGQQVQDNPRNLFDMINYDASTKTMRKPAEEHYLKEEKKYFGHLQIMVPMAVVLCSLVFIYLKCRSRRDPPPAQPQEPQHQEMEDRDHLAGEGAPQLRGNQVRQRHVNIPKEPGKVAVKTLRPAEPHDSEDEKDARLSVEEQNPAAELDSENQQANDGQFHENQVSQRHDSGPEEKPGKVAVKTLRAAEHHNSEDEKDARLSEQEQNPAAELDSENQQWTQEEQAGASSSSAAADTAQSETESDSSPSPSETAERRPSQTDVQDPQASAQDSNLYALLEQSETPPAPVQEADAILAE